ncbi:hypothetical protein [Carboxylicivirga sp. RSCT41]|uniref:hypothetical protein n=1 Tax=Carboxylicivirga agarovorans TaxID=3417570 RepID=UPI003D344446
MGKYLGKRVTGLRGLSFGTLFLLLGLLAFVSCEKEEQKEAGNIPGMGNAGGELQAEEYVFHQDLLLGAITGYEGTSSAARLKADYLKIEGMAQGSGEQVKVTVEITNTHPEECRSLWLRAGTVFDVNHAGYQNAILLAPVNVCVPPNSTKTVTLYLYCLNLGMNGSDGTAAYELLGVTTSEAVLELINLLQFKKVNYEHYVYFPEPDIDYNEVKDKLQDILWKITNGDGMDASDQAFIESLPMLPEGTFPENIYNLEAILPDCWCVDECEVVENSGALSYVAFQTNCEGELSAELDGGLYKTNGFSFNVETNYPSLEGYIKFESVSEPALGEDGAIETAVFVFWAPCHDEQIVVTTKNKDEITEVIDISEEGQAVLMSNGFMVEFISVAEGDNGYYYTFNVVSDSCPGSNK